MQIKLTFVIKSVLVKICSKSPCKCINTGSFSLEWKKVNVVPVYKKFDKCFRNYRSVPLLPICLNIIERLLKTS